MNTPTAYIPRRDERFYYLSDVLEHIEETQCVNCLWRSGEFPTSECPQVNGVDLLLEIQVPEFIDYGDRIVCTEHKEA